jgi:hypothetical protein
MDTIMWGTKSSDVRLSSDENGFFFGQTNKASSVSRTASAAQQLN